MRILKRMLDFIASRMLMVTVACALLIISFYLAMNTANIWVLIDDGLDARASVVLMGEDAGKLTSYFRPEFIAQDPVLQVGMSDTSPYRDYEIRGYDHRVKMVSVWSWPWENVARAEVVESIPAIDGTIRSAKREAALAEGGEERLSPPAWTTTRYRVTLVRTAGRWLISNLSRLRSNMNFDFSNRGAMLAPMAGVTDMPFRVLCHEMGCPMAVSEMVSAKGYSLAPKG